MKLIRFHNAAEVYDVRLRENVRPGQGLEKRSVEFKQRNESRTLNISISFKMTLES